MNWIYSLACGLICALAGGLAAGCIAHQCTTWYHVPDREGASFMYILYLAVAGAAMGFAIGTGAARYAPGGAFTTGLGYGLASVLALAVLAGFLARLGGDVPPVLEGSRLMLQMELRAPEAWRLTNTMKSKPGGLILASVTEGGRKRHKVNGDLDIQDARLDQGRYIVPGGVYLFTPKGLRRVTVRLGQEDLTTFDVPLPPHPGAAELNWSGWLPAGSGGFEYRFRVQTLVQRELERTRERQSRQQTFASLTPASPLREFLPFLKDPSFDVRQQVSREVARRPVELIPLLDPQEPAMLSLALAAAAEQSSLPEDFEPSLLRVLDSQLEEIRRLRRTAEMEQDPDAKGAAALQRDFVAWFSAWQRAHTNGRTVPPALNQLIQEAGQTRDPSLAEAREIAPLARRYLSEWR